MKLNESTRQFLKELKYDPSSRGSFMHLPFSGPYWEDEGADKMVEIPHDERNEVIALFGARIKHWTEEPLSEDEQALWDQCLAEFPECPIFKRMEATPEIMNALDECAEGTKAFFESFGEGTTIDVEEGEYGLVELTRHPRLLETTKPMNVPIFDPRQYLAPQLEAWVAAGHTSDEIDEAIHRAGERTPAPSAAPAIECLDRDPRRADG